MTRSNLPNGLTCWACLALESQGCAWVCNVFVPRIAGTSLSGQRIAGKSVAFSLVMMGDGSHNKALHSSISRTRDLVPQLAGAITMRSTSAAFAGQLLHAAEPAEDATVLLRQKMQASLEAAPSVADAKPAEHGVQVVEFN